jgi:hypothetical protein
MQPSAPVDAVHPTPANRQAEPMTGGHSHATAIGADPLGQSMNLMGATMVYPRNTEIFGENEPADYLYKVVSGSVRTYKILSDGRRQVGGFYLPGDLFGLEFADEHTLSAEAISDAKVLVVKRSALTALAGHDALVAQQLFNLTGREFSSGNGGAGLGQFDRSADVASGHRRLSWADNRNRVAHAHFVGMRRGDRGTDIAAHRLAQQVGIVAHERLTLSVETKCFRGPDKGRDPSCKSKTS